MYYKSGGGQDLSPVIAAINMRLPVADRIPEYASSAEIVAALNKITNPIINLVNTKLGSPLPATASTQQILDGMRAARVSVFMRGIANRSGSNEFRAELEWSGSGNANKISGTSASGDSSVSTTESFIVYS